MKILHLNVKKKWFDLYARGEKPIEYRTANAYWYSRLYKNGFIQFDEIHIKNGYARKGKPSPIIKFKHKTTTIDLVDHPETHKREMCFLIYVGEILYLYWGG
jgi:hypothetical protein